MIKNRKLYMYVYVCVLIGTSKQDFRNVNNHVT